MIRIGILEDDPDVWTELRSCLDGYRQQGKERIEYQIFSNADDFLETPMNYDILLLDIYLGKRSRDGMEVARLIREKNQDVLIIFVTNLSQYAILGYAVNAFDFIVKPLDAELLQEKLERALRHIQAKRIRYITLRTADGMARVDMTSIYYIEVFGHNLMFHTKEGKLITRGSLSSVVSMLESEQFFRCHAAYLVNLRQVEKVENLTVRVGQSSLPISRHRRKEFMQALVKCLQIELL